MTENSVAAAQQMKKITPKHGQNAVLIILEAVIYDTKQSFTDTKQSSTTGLQKLREDLSHAQEALHATLLQS